MTAAPLHPAGARAWFGLTLAYALLGALGLALAIPPGYASPVFPAAGLAMAAVLRHGARILPGVWLGSLALNLGVALNQGNLSATAALVAAGIATGSSLQALCGRWLILRWGADKWQRLDQESDIFRFLALSGPLACLIAATVGISSLHAAGIVSREAFAFSWWSWYVGDTLGVLLFAPLTLGALNRRDAAWQGRYRVIAIPVLGALLLAAAVFFGAARWESETQRQDLQEQGETLARFLESRFIAHREALAALARLIETTPELGPEQFGHFTASTLADKPDLFALSFNPYVRQGQRRDFERRMARVSPEGRYEITERDGRGELVSAGERAEYVAVGYIAPLAGNRPAIGYDIHSEPVRRDAIRRARASGRMALTSALRLVQERQERIGLLALAPAYSRGDERALIGFAVAVIKVDEMVEIATRGRLPDGLVLQIDGPGDAGGRQAYFRSDGGAARPAAGQLWESTLAMADQAWALRVFPTQAYLQQHRPWIAWGVGVAGLLVATLLQVLMLSLTGRAALVQRRVEEQTAEIRAKNEALTQSGERTRRLNEELEKRNAELGREIGERMKAEQGLKLSAAVLEKAAEGVMVTDAENRIILVNDAFCRITGYAAEEVLGRHPNILGSGRQGADFYRAMWQALAEQHQWQGEIVNRRKDGTIYPEWLSISVVPDEAGRPANYIGVFSDISERKGAEVVIRALNASLEQRVRERTGELELANRKLESFSYSISHDLRAPLRAIHGFASLIGEDAAARLTEEERQWFERIRFNAARMGSLIDDILQFSRINRAEMNIAEVDLAALAREVAEEQRGAYPQAEVKIGTLPRVQADAGLLRQALENLLSNALKFSAKCGRPRVDVGCQPYAGGTTLFWVRDNGAGFDMQYATHLFEVFQRMHKESDYPGTGVGLAIVKNVIERHDGRVWAESAPGEGATFYFTLPAGRGSTAPDNAA